jgi:long-subunit acyl-CoA synthetase (AMP-forming)
MLSHENAVANSEQAYKVDVKAMNWELDSHLGVLPMFHIYVCSNCGAFLLNATQKLTFLP